MLIEIIIVLFIIYSLQVSLIHFIFSLIISSEATPYIKTCAYVHLRRVRTIFLTDICIKENICITCGFYWDFMRRISISKEYQDFLTIMILIFNYIFILYFNNIALLISLFSLLYYFLSNYPCLFLKCSTKNGPLK